MTTTLNAAALVSHPMGVCCPDCGRAAHEGDTIRHSNYCEIAPKGTTRCAKVGAPVVEAPAAIVTHARRGDLRLHYDDSEIVQAVREGRISVDDAMNQDF